MLDYFDLEGDLDGEERMILETTREFVDAEIRPDIDEQFEAGHFPEELIGALGELGVYGANLSIDATAGVSELAYGLIMQELEAGDSGIRSMVSVQGALVMWPIATYGSDRQRERWIEPLATGDAVGCFGLTEPAHGSDPAGMDAVAERDGDEYILNGAKTWITNAPIANMALIWARDQSAPGEPVRGFLVDTDLPGVTTSELTGKLSMRVSSTGEIGLTDVRVTQADMLPDVSGMKGPLSCLTQARYGIAWGAIGAARDCFETARTYAGEREQFGRPIASFQLQQEKLAEMASQITASQLMAYRLAELKDRNELTHQQVSMAKRFNVRMARDQARIAREILGANGIMLEYSPIRHMANMETVYTYEGTHDIHSLILGEDLTGVSAFE